MVVGREEGVPVRADRDEERVPEGELPGLAHQQAQAERGNRGREREQAHPQPRAVHVERQRERGGEQQRRDKRFGSESPSRAHPDMVA